MERMFHALDGQFFGKYRGLVVDNRSDPSRPPAGEGAGGYGEESYGRNPARPMPATGFFRVAAGRCRRVGRVRAAIARY
jgi:hypothetical protein